jgi:hypothetical protein
MGNYPPRFAYGGVKAIDRKRREESVNRGNRTVHNFISTTPYSLHPAYRWRIENRDGEGEHRE